jgi:DNA-binding GntR family transcriptional regulator
MAKSRANRAVTTATVPRTASGRVRAAIEKDILSGALPPGTRLDEMGVSARFRVSRTPVREALNQLAASGLVAIRAHEGATVVKPTPVELLEKFEVMTVLESSCARIAAQRHTVSDQTAMRRALVECKRAEASADSIAFHDANNRFHEAIYRATHNGFLAQQALTLRNRLIPFRRYIAFHPGRMSRSNAQHQAIMSAIFALEAEHAAVLMSEHLATLRDDVIAIFSSDGGRQTAPKRKRA